MRTPRKPFCLTGRPGAEPRRLAVWDPYRMRETRVGAEWVETDARNMLRGLMERR